MSPAETNIMASLTKVNEKLCAENERLKLENAWLRRKLFGVSSDRLLPEKDETPFLDGLAPHASAPEPEKEVQTVAAHERKKAQPFEYEVIPADAPVKEIIITDPECEKKGLKPFGFIESERVAVQRSLLVLRYKRMKYNDPDRGLVVGPAPGDFFDTPSGKTKYDASFLAKVVSDKCEFSIPLERQAKMLASSGFHIAPSTLGYIVSMTVSSTLKILYERMVSLIRHCEILHADETHIKLVEKGRKKCRQAYFWCQMAGVGPPMVTFHFAPTRSKDVAELLLGNYSGTIIRDSYVGYSGLACEAACCWAHVRRKFFDAREAGYLHAEEFLKLIGNLYRIEQVAKTRAEEKNTEAALFQERRVARRESRIIVKAFFDRCRQVAEMERPSSPVLKAINYALNIEENLEKFLDNPKLNIDNNPAERAIRGIAIMRKNCLFAGSETGGQNLAIILSFVETCRANKISFRVWLEDVLRRFSSTPAKEIDSLLPQNWKPVASPLD